MEIVKPTYSITDTSRVCPRCKLDQPRSSYSPKVWDRTAKGGYPCNPCKSKTNYAWKLRYRYGLTVEQHTELRNKQGNKCALCGKAPTETRKLMVDHDHETGRVRGLLCTTCNSALGSLGDNEAGLLRALKYLRGK